MRLKLYHITLQCDSTWESSPRASFWKDSLLVCFSIPSQSLYFHCWVLAKHCFRYLFCARGCPRLQEYRGKKDFVPQESAG